MRPIWSGSVSFGLVNIPVRLYSPASQKGLDFDMIHKKDFSPIRYAKFCRAEDREIPKEEIVKGYEFRKGYYVILNDEDFQKANVHKSQSIDILGFADESEVDPIYYEKPYYLEPDRGGAKAYSLLRDSLNKSNKVGIAKFVLRNREHMALVKPDGSVLLLQQLRYKYEVQDTSQLSLPGSEAEDVEIQMALDLISKFTKEFKPEDYHDTYEEELLRVIEEKSQGIEPVPKGKAPEPTKVPDLMAALRASLEKSAEELGKTA